MGGVTCLFILLCSCHMFTGDGCLWHGCLQSFISGTYITVKKNKNKNRIISADTHSPNLGTSHFFSWFLLGKKDIKKPRPGWRGPKDTNFHYEISYTVGLTIVTRLHITSLWKWKSLCRVQLFATPWTIQFMEFPPAMREIWVWSLVGKIPWRRERLPTSVFWPGEFHELYSPGVAKSWTWLSNLHFHEGVMSSLVTIVNPTVLNTWKVIRQ